jgi:hypothetical protein
MAGPLGAAGAHKVRLRVLPATRGKPGARDGGEIYMLRDDAEYYSSVRGFSVRSLIKNCWFARDGLDSDDRKFIEHLKETSCSCVKRRQVRKLLALRAKSARSSTANLFSCVRSIVLLSSAFDETRPCTRLGFSAPTTLPIHASA